MEDYSIDAQSFWNRTDDGGSRGIGTYPALVLVGSIFVVVTVGVLGNLLTVHTVLSSKKMRTSGNFLLMSLSLSDTCVLLFSLAVILSRTLLAEINRNNAILCKMPIYLLILSGIISVNHLPVIAYNRYSIVTKDGVVHGRCFSKMRMIIIVTCLWILPAIVLVMPTLGFGEIDFVPELGGCGLVETTLSGWLYTTFLVSNTVVSCGLITPVFYVLTFKKINHFKNRVREAPSLQSGTDLRPGPTGFSKEELALTRMALLAFCCFVVCWLPTFVLHLATFRMFKPLPLATMFRFLAFSSSTFNPLIYVGTNKSFRREFGRKNIFRFIR